MLIAITVRLIAAPGASASHGATSTKSRELLIISPQIDGLLSYAETQKAQHGAEQDRERDFQTALDDNRWPRIGQPLAPQNVRQALATGACREDEFARHQVERHTAGHPRDRRYEQDANRNRCFRQAGRRHRDDQQDQQRNNPAAAPAAKRDGACQGRIICASCYLVVAS